MHLLCSYLLGGTVFVLIAGTISHFLYHWFGKHFVAACFFPVNESTWEHMKLVFFPMWVSSLYIEPGLRQTYPGIASSLLFGILSGTMLIPVIFYTYSGILGRHCLTLDIATFILSVCLGFWVVYRGTLSCRLLNYCQFLRVAVFLMAGLFFLFTWLPPSWGLFQSPEKL